MILALLLGWLPEVSTIPVVDSYLVSASQGLHKLVEIVPFFGDLLTAFLVYIGFRLTMIVAKVLLGSRMPMYN